MTDDDDWITNGLLVPDAVTAADVVEPGDTVLVSGFGGIGYPKQVPEALAAADRYLALTVISRGGIGVALVEADQMARRFLFQKWEVSRSAINDGEVVFHDRHISRFGDEVRLGDFGNLDVAVIKAVAVVRIGLSFDIDRPYAVVRRRRPSRR